MIFNKPKITRILFATDLSENANQAFLYAASLAESYGANVTVLHVLEKLPPNAEMLVAAFLEYRDVDELREKTEIELTMQIKKRVHRFCAEAADQIPECRFMVDEVVVEPGKAAERILHHIETGIYDVLVMGSRGHGVIQNIIFGGTAHKVLRECRIPVFLIPLAS
jgi:nucleotide-binding universal stress UspA family protein